MNGVDIFAVERGILFGFFIFPGTMAINSFSFFILFSSWYITSTDIKMNTNGVTILIVILLIVGVLFLVGRCKLDCTEKATREGYVRSCLAGDCFGLQRTPVDYALKYPHGWQRNPHYRANPRDEHQPLDYGPIDFHSDLRRLDKFNGVLFQQYGNWWTGCGKDIVYLTNDSKNRFDLTNVGDYGARQTLDDMYNQRFGPKGWNNTERQYDEPNPYYTKLYGGPSYLTHDKLGD